MSQATHAKKNILTIMEKTPKEQIIDTLAQAMSWYAEQATDVFGEGYFGRVFRLNFSPKMNVKVKDNEVTLNTVVKRFKRPGQGFYLYDFSQEFIDSEIKTFYDMPDRKIDVPKITIPKGTSCLIFDDHMAGEMIILMYISNLWYDSVTPHVPYLIMPMAMESNEIDSLLLEMNGLPGKYNYFPRLIDPGIYGRVHFSSHLENWFELVAFVINRSKYDEKQDKYLIPRLDFEVDPETKMMKLVDETPVLDFVEVFDSLLLSYLITLHHLRSTLNLTLSDQRLENTFIGFTKFSLHAGQRSLVNLKRIRYDLKDKSDKSYEIPVHDVILKIGDIGSGVMKVRDDLILVGDINMSDDYYIHKIFLVDKLPGYLYLLINLNESLPMDMRIRLINNRILNSDKFRRTSLIEGVDFTYPTEIELVEQYFSDYLTDDKSKDSDELFVVKI